MKPKPDFEAIGAGIGRLVAEKNAAYGDSFSRSGEIMAILYPDGIRREQMADALGVVRVIDKLFRIANDKGYGGESPWRDISGYGLLGEARHAIAELDAEERETIRYALGCRP